MDSFDPACAMWRFLDDGATSAADNSRSSSRMELSWLMRAMSAATAWHAVVYCCTEDADVKEEDHVVSGFWRSRCESSIIVFFLVF